MIDNIMTPVYWVACDNCGRDHQTEETAVTAEDADRMAREEGWTVQPRDVHWCPECSCTIEVCS